jgi:hypothetical protein
MTKKPKQLKKGTKNAKRTKGPAQPQEEPDTITTSTPTVGQPEVVTVETQQAAGAAVEVPTKTVAETPALTKSVGTPSPEPRAAIKDGIAAHKAIGSPSKFSLIAGFG